MKVQLQRLVQEDPLCFMSSMYGYIFVFYVLFMTKPKVTIFQAPSVQCRIYIQNEKRMPAK